MVGAGISPYMFFWQAAQEAEEKIEECDESLPQCLPRRGKLPSVKPDDIRNMRLDTVMGMFFSRLAAWFIIITAAGSLHKAGITNVASASDAAKALIPLVKGFPYAGIIAESIFAIGIIGLGLLAVPVFAGSIGYAVGGTLNWRIGLFRPPAKAPEFYGVIIAATLVGMFIALAGFNAISLLVFAAVINGIVTVPLVFLIILIGSNRDIMGQYVNGAWTNVAGWITFVVIGIAAVNLFVIQVLQVIHGL
jgi:Mn2+/Fe2+ NRAMP family transporter